MHSYELEQHFLAALLQYPKKYFEVSAFIDSADFFSENSKVNKSLFHLISQAIKNGETPDPAILIDRATSIGLTFEDNISLADYIHTLSYRKVNEEALIDTAKALKKLSVRRTLHDSFLEGAKKNEVAPSYLHF